MHAELISVGTEILLGQIDNSHARYLSQELAALGISVYFHSSVGDNEVRVIDLVRKAISRSEIILLTGGLGPTQDDLTRDAVAKACDLPLVFSQESYVEHVLPYFARHGRLASESNRRQAMRIGDAQFLVNARGTAPGQYLRFGSAHIFLLPGPPLELRPMFKESVLPILAQLTGQSAIVSRVLHLFGMGESAAAERVADLIDAQVNPTIAPLAAEGEMLFRLTAKADSQIEAQALIAPLETTLRERFAAYIYGVDDDSIASVVLEVLRRAGKTCALAESCTGGMASSMIVDIPGSSTQFRGGVVAYDNAVKTAVLQVPASLLARVGAVSEEVARAMADGVRRNFGADVGIGITGIAGPQGGSPDKPVGLVYIAVADECGAEVRAYTFSGDRMQIRIRAAKTALYMLYTRVRELNA